jgi:UDP-N-acetylglucosamine acyltransferase
MQMTILSTGDALLNELIHPTAIVHAKAELHPTVKVGPYAVIGGGVKIGAGTTVGSHVVIEGRTEIGVGNRIFNGAVIGSEPQDLKYRGADTLVKIGDRNQIREFVTINRATSENEATIIGNDNLLMACVHIAHNCVIENEVIIANNTVLAGHIYVESQARISGVLGIHQFVRIGKLAMVAGMSRIEKDIPPYTMVEGNPARVRSLNLVGLKRNGLNSAEISEIKKAFRSLYHSDLPFTKALEQLNSIANNEYVQHLHEFLKLSLSEEGRRGATPGKD